MACGPCPNQVHSPRCGRKCSEHNRAQVLLLLGPQFPCVKTRGVYKLVVVNIWGFGSVATGGKAELRSQVLPQTWGDPFTSPDRNMDGTLGEESSAWSCPSLRSGVLSWGRLVLAPWGSARQLRVQWAHSGTSPVAKLWGARMES